MPDPYPTKRGRSLVNLILVILALLIALLLILLVKQPWGGSDAEPSRSSQNLSDPQETTDEAIEETTDGTTLEEATDETSMPAETTEESTAAGAVPGTSVNLVAVGDVLFHETLIAGGLQDDGSYNYDFVFQYVADRVREADVGFADMEGTLAGEPYTGYPAFSAPDAVAEAVANAGFSGMYLANNHSIDRGYSGLTRTLEVVRGEGLLTVGTRLDTDEPDWLDVDINGIRVGIANWTYETAMEGSVRTLNGIPITEEIEGLVNSFGMEPDRQPSEFARAAEQAKDMREAGCDLVIFFCHWGTEYRMENDWAQLGLAQTLAEADVDLIIGNGPHVIEPIHLLTNEDGSHRTLVYYSVGNFISDQSYSVGGSEGRALDGLMADVTFTMAEDGAMHLTDAAYMPLYVAKTKLSETATRNTAVPVVAALADPAAYGSVPVSELEASLARTRQVMSLNDTGDLAIREY